MQACSVAQHTVDQGCPVILRIKRKWFDLIASGAKTTEFRRASTYWKKALMIRTDVRRLRFVNGYSKSAPSLVCEFISAELMQTTSLPAELAPPPGSLDFIEMFGDADEVIGIKLGRILQHSCSSLTSGVSCS
jgi:hypothetical protein